MFQIELLEGWMIHNMLNEDLLIQYKEPHFKRQHMDSVLLLEIVRNYRKQGCGTQFLVYLRGYGNEHD